MPEVSWHVTLRFIGEADPADACDAIDGTPLPSATARLGPAIRRLGRIALVVPVDGLAELAAVVNAATAHVGRASEPRPFKGHITLARLKPRSVRTIEGTSAEHEFQVDHVELVRSELSPHGARYHTVASWPTTMT